MTAVSAPSCCETIRRLYRPGITDLQPREIGLVQVDFDGRWYLAIGPEPILALAFCPWCRARLPAVTPVRPLI